MSDQRRGAVEHPHYHAPSQEDLGSFDAPADLRHGTQALPFRGPLQVDSGKHHRPTAEDVRARAAPVSGRRRARA